MGLVLVVIFAGLMVFFTLAARRLPRLHLRDLPAFARLQRGIGLAVEAGQRLHLTLGHGGVSGIRGGATLVGLGLLQRIARAASISDNPPIATSGEAVQAILSQDAQRSAFNAVNAESQYSQNSGQLTGLTPFSYAAGTLPVIYDEQVSVNILAGSFGSEVALIADAAERTGSISLGGSENLAAQAVLYAAAHEPLIGEELYASGAYINAGKMHEASVRTQDVVRWILIVAVIGGALIKLLGVL
jgi:hypothetical protein